MLACLFYSAGFDTSLIVVPGVNSKAIDMMMKSLIKPVNEKTKKGGAFIMGLNSRCQWACRRACTPLKRRYW